MPKRTLMRSPALPYQWTHPPPPSLPDPTSTPQRERRLRCFSYEPRRAVEYSHRTRTAARADEERAAVRHLIFWRNGFELGRGTPLRRYDDPAQEVVLAEINVG